MLEFSNLLPNAVFLLRIRHDDETRNSLVKIRESIESLSHMFDIDKIKLSVTDVNHILYKCEKEELYLTNGKRGVYDIPR